MNNTQQQQPLCPRWPATTNVHLHSDSGLPTQPALCCTSATGGTPGAPVEPLAENEPITASANPPLSHQDPEPEHHPNPEHPAPKPTLASTLASLATDTDWVTDAVATLGTTLSPESAEVHNLGPASTASSSATTASSTAPSRATTSSYSVHLTHGTEKSTLEHATKTQNKHKLTAESLVAEGDDTKPSNSNSPKTV
ncbi:unnamed protein product [Microthlaspi erraticum]|uniref:Uncharacterized protein n=1 Tax=Microthlaspi erraticum TaxID=1685480 RepID=A0A6D2HI59_9BRAS|nr:unnamed protein product [Microthlaspi erraticum]